MMRISDIEKQHQAFTEHSTRCQCGHTMLIASKDGKKLCKHCHRYVFINKKAELMYRNKETLIKAKKELYEQRRDRDRQTL